MTHLATVFATAAALFAAGATPAPAASAPPPPSPARPCTIDVDTAGARGNDTAHTITVGSPPTMTTDPTTFLDDVLMADTVAVGPLTGYDSGGMTITDTRHVATATRSGRIYRHQRQYSYGIGAPTGEDSGWSSWVAVRGLPPVRALAESSSTLYTLDGGTLRRFVYVGNSNRMSSGGTATGYSTYRGLTVARIEKDRDILLATTTRGALMRIEVPKTRAFTPRVHALRTTTWQVYDRLVARRCGAATTLVGLNSRTGQGHVYTLGAARTPSTSTPIRHWGALPQPIRGPFTLRSTFTRQNAPDPDDEW